MTDKSLFATPYRYEIELFGPKYFNWRRRFNDNLKAARENRHGIEDETERQTGKDAIDHLENLEKRAFRRRSERMQVNIKKEMKDENKANVRVRRAALRHQLELDYKQYAKELSGQGKAIYFQRV